MAHDLGNPWLVIHGMDPCGPTRHTEVVARWLCSLAPATWRSRRLVKQLGELFHLPNLGILSRHKWDIIPKMMEIQDGLIGCFVCLFLQHGRTVPYFGCIVLEMAALHWTYKVGYLQLRIQSNLSKMVTGAVQRKGIGVMPLLYGTILANTYNTIYIYIYISESW